MPAQQNHYSHMRSTRGTVQFGGAGKGSPAPPPTSYSLGEVDGDPMDDVLRKVQELKLLVGELEALDRERVGMGDRLVDLEHYFRKAGCPELSQKALDAFMVTYAGRVFELADGMRG